MFITNILEDFFSREILGIMYLSSCLKKAGHKTDIALSQDSLQTAKKFRPDVLAYSTTTGFHKKFLEINTKLREEIDALSIFGGPHPTFFPEMIREDNVDAICIGEGEEAIVDFANRLEKGVTVKDTPNFWVKEKNKIYKNPIRPLIENIDEIPFPDRELFYNKYKLARNNKIKSCITTRGCPYSCTYCFNHQYNKLYRGKGKIIRMRTVDNVIEELKLLKKYPLDLVHFATDTFILDEKWIHEFSIKYKKEIGVPFYCGVRANLVKKDIIRNLKKAGCVSVAMGVETGNEKIRNELLKRNLTEQQIIDAARIIHDDGINLLTQNMLALPTETLENAFETFALNVNCKSDYATASLYQPYPKTDLGEYSKKEGLFIGNFGNLEQIFFNTSPLIIDQKEKRRIENFQKLFAIGVSFPFLFPLIKQLIKLPPNKAFQIAYKIWKGYTGKNKIFVHELTFKEFFYTLSRYMKGGIK